MGRKNEESRLKGLPILQRHNKLIETFINAHKRINSESCASERSVSSVVKSHLKFHYDEKNESKLSWEEKLAKRYYDRLFKEYCVADLEHYEKNKIAMRWRTEKELKSGKGQFLCGSRNCVISDDLNTWEVNFKYVEDAETKNILVKLRLCEECSKKLNYHTLKRRVTKLVKDAKKRKHQPDVKESRDDEGYSPKEVKRQFLDHDKEDTPSKSTITPTDIDNVWSKPIELDDTKKLTDEMDDFLNNFLFD
uniref:Protein FRA10AC1 homolog n=1 Tax=Rhabditophanes sp. KR3021 TaxID=114890 RepID=A0AC35TSH1_9BILA